MNTTQNQDTGQDGRAGSTHSQTGNRESIKQGSEELKQGAEELRSKATEIAQDAKREGKAQVDEYRNVAAQKVDTIAESVKAAAAKLEEGDVGKWSTQISGMADSMGRLSQGLREKSADEVLHDVNRLARENPAIFVGSAVAIGFGLTRLMRATAQPRPDKEQGRTTGTQSKDGAYTSGYSTDRDDAYTSSTIGGSGASSISSTPGGTTGSYASGGIGAGAASGSSGGTGSYSTGGSGTGVGTGSTGTGLAGASSQPGQSGFSGTSGSQGSGNTRSGESGLDDNDRRKSS